MSVSLIKTSSPEHPATGLWNCCQESPAGVVIYPTGEAVLACRGCLHTVPNKQRGPLPTDEIGRIVWSQPRNLVNGPSVPEALRCNSLTYPSRCVNSVSQRVAWSETDERGTRTLKDSRIGCLDCMQALTESLVGDDLVLSIVTFSV